MHQSIEIVPAEALQISQNSEPELSWFWRAYEVAEAELNRPVMRALTSVFAFLVCLFYIGFAAIILWKPGA